MADNNDIPDLFDVEIEPVDPNDPTPASNVSAPLSASHSLSQSNVAPISNTGNTGGHSSRQSAPDPLIGIRLKGAYELVGKIGEGGMGSVYAAIQYPLERKVAIKILKPSESNPEGNHYFMREVKIINSLRHPNIINIVDYGEEDGMLFLVMEHLPGLTLKQVIKKDYPLDPKRVCHILIQLLGALEQAHASEIVHCDLKPANIMVEKVAGQPDFVKVLDFGIAKAKGPAMEAGPYTQAGNIVGTFDYMSPEQIMRKDLDGRADIWSIGVILYEMLTRKRIFHDRDAVSIIGRVMQMAILPPSEIAPDVAIPSNLERITLRAMERNVKKRYQTAKEMRDALKRTLKELESGNTGNLTHSEVHSGNLGTGLAGSGLVQGGTGLLAGSQAGGPANTGLATGRTGLSSLYTRSGSFGSFSTEHSQRMAAELAAGSSILDQSFAASELQGSLVGERRQVAVLAVQQKSRRQAGIDPEELARRSTQERSIIQEIVKHFDGEIDSHLGGTYTVLFGARRARVGDNLRALRCAVALKERFQSLDQGAEHIGIGVVYGEIFVSDRKAGNAYGDAIDRAVEIARAGKNASVVADPELVQSTRDAVDFAPPRNVAGTEASEVIAVRSPGDSEEAVQDVDVFVPRPALFDQLLRRAKAARENQGGGVAIQGDLGTGKTVLLDRLQKNLKETGWQTFIARDSQREGQQGLGPVRDWIRKIAKTYKDPEKLIRSACESIGLKRHIDEVIKVYLGEQSDAIGQQDLPWIDAKGYSNFTASLLYRLLRFAMKKGPVLLGVDDILSMDAFTMEFLASLLEGTQKQPILIVLTQRIESSALDHGLPGSFEILPIGGFGEEESRQYIAQVLGYTPPMNIVQQVHVRSSGNPMFLHELVRNVLQRNGGKLTDENQLLDANVPMNLQALLGARVDILPDNARDLLAIASVIGESFREDFFRQITPSHLEPGELVKDLVALNFLEAHFDSFGRIQVAFQPRALRRVVYDRLPKSTRHSIHSRIIEFLEQAPDYAAVDPLEYPLMVAFHYRAVEGWEGAAYYLTRAGELMLEFYDYAGAATQLKEAVALIDGKVEPTHETLMLARARLLVALRESGHLEDARQVISRLPDLSSVDSELRQDLLFEKGMISLEAGVLDDAEQHLRLGLQEAQQTGDTKREIKNLLAIAQIYERENQLPRAAQILIDVSQKVEGLGELNLHDPDDRKLCWTAYNQLGTLFIRQKDYQKAQQFLQAAYERARAIEDFRGLVRVMSNFGALSLSMRDVERALTHFQSAAQFAGATGDLLNQSRIFTNMGITAMESGDLNSSKTYFKQARSIAEEIGWYEGLAELALHIKRLRNALSS